jgi:hypothetical protein
MTASRIHTLPDSRDGLFVYDGTDRIGWAYPKTPGDPHGVWYGKPMRVAREFVTRLEAIAWLADVPAEQLAHLETEEAP